MNSETGHAINVANFEDLISRVTGYGITYNPINAAIKQTALSSIFTSGKAVLLNVDNALIPNVSNIDAREIIFAPLPKLITRVSNSVASMGTTPHFIADVKTYTRKIQGKRATPKIKVTPTPAIATPTPTPVPTPPLPVPYNISASQMSYDNRIENFQKLIILLKSDPLYIPNETDLTVASLTALLASMVAANTAVIGTTTQLINARIARDKVLYTPETGLYAIQLEVKKYVKSIYGSKSSEFKEIEKIKFTNHYKR